MMFHGGYITFGQTNLRGHYMQYTWAEAEADA